MLTVAPVPPDPGVALRARLAGFAGFLRANGYPVGAGDATRVLETAQLAGVFDGDVLQWSLKALLCSRGDEWRRFDSLFDAYFLPANRRTFDAHGIVDANHGAQHIGVTGDSDKPLPVAGPGDGIADVE